jgi:broad specificity phosphatase PhoE
MKVYFVRHGESESNQQKIRLGPSASLTQTGREQAQLVANRLKLIQVDRILTSPYPRASQTAEIIQKTITSELHIHDDIHEIKSPSVYLGRSNDDPEVIALDELRWQNFKDETWHHSDEENLADSRTRAKKFIHQLSDMSDDTIIVVTHANFLRTLLAEMVFGEILSTDIYRCFAMGIVLGNTGITVVENRTDGSWKIITLNDLTHLE